MMLVRIKNMLDIVVFDENKIMIYNNDIEFDNDVVHEKYMDYDM